MTAARPRLVVAVALVAAATATGAATPAPTPVVTVGPTPVGSSDTAAVEDLIMPVEDLVFGEASLDGAVTDEGNQRFRLASDVLFAFDKADLTPRARTEITRIADRLRAAGATGRITVEGHTDAVGDDDYNLDLSRRRAEAVRGALADALGVTVTATGAGETRPIASNGTDAGRAVNRRVEIRAAG